MLPKYHIIFGSVISLLVYFLFSISFLETLVIFLSSFLLDMDHYFLYVFRKKDFSLKNSINYFNDRRKKWLSMNFKKRKNYKRAIFIFHGIEFWLLLFILANYNSLIWFILLGIGIHMFLDYIDIINNKDSFYTKFSQLYVYYTNKRKKDFF